MTMLQQTVATENFMFAEKLDDDQNASMNAATSNMIAPPMTSFRASGAVIRKASLLL